MSYQVIARRWRPRRFADIAGQDHIVRTLQNALRNERLAHAYLFVGPRGTGKTTTARVFATALNAEGGPNPDPDPEHPVSQAIMAGTFLDVIEIDGASNNSVEQVRSLREECQYAPTQSRFKVYIIDEVHMLSTAAFNALLKTLEEPPAHVKFIFATTEAHKVLPTIVSRCQRFEFRPIAAETIIERLEHIAAEEGIEVEAGALQQIALLASGGMRDAQSILDQLIAFCGNRIDAGDVLDVYGLASPERIEQLARALAQGDHAALIDAAEALANEGRDLYRVLVDVQRRIRAVLFEAIRGGGTTQALGTQQHLESLTRLLEALQAGERSVQKGLNERVNFELALLKAVEASRSRAIDAVIRQLGDLAERLPENADRAEKKSPQPILSPA